MRCPYCAEEIQDAAVLCRFCGATRRDHRWAPPTAPRSAPAPRGHFTIQSAGWLLGLSGLYGLCTVTSSVPLFGQMRTGWAATVYNLVFAAAFVLIAFALIRRRPWALQAMLWGTVLYSADRLQFAFSGGTLEAYLQSGLSAEVDQLIDSSTRQMLLTYGRLLFITLALSSLGCWWGFVAYLYARHTYFQPAATASEPASASQSH